MSYRKERELHGVVEEKTPRVVIRMVNGDVASFVFPVYNFENGKLEPIDLTDSTTDFKVFVDDSAPHGFAVNASIDETVPDDAVRNGIRLDIGAAIVNSKAKDLEWPVVVGFNIVGMDRESYVHGEIVIEKAPFGKTKENN